MTDRYTLKEGKLVVDEAGELVRYQDLEQLQTELTAAQASITALQADYGNASEAAEAASAEARENKIRLEKIRRYVGELVPAPAPMPAEKVDELARGMVAQLQRAISPP